MNQENQVELLTHRLNVALRALTLIHEMAKKRSRVNMQDGTSLELFASSAIREAMAHDENPPAENTAGHYEPICQNHDPAFLSALEVSRNEGYRAGYSTACVTLRELITDLNARVQRLEQDFARLNLRDLSSERS